MATIISFPARQEAPAPRPSTDLGDILRRYIRRKNPEPTRHQYCDVLEVLDHLGPREREEFITHGKAMVVDASGAWARGETD